MNINSLLLMFIFQSIFWTFNIMPLAIINILVFLQWTFNIGPSIFVPSILCASNSFSVLYVWAILSYISKMVNMLNVFFYSYFRQQGWHCPAGLQFNLVHLSRMVKGSNVPVPKPLLKYLLKSFMPKVKRILYNTLFILVIYLSSYYISVQ